MTQNQDYCTGQCWYDQIVYYPAGHPNIVYLGGSYDYNTYARSTNGRALLLSRDAGADVDRPDGGCDHGIDASGELL